MLKIKRKWNHVYFQVYQTKKWVPGWIVKLLTFMDFNEGELLERMVLNEKED